MPISKYLKGHGLRMVVSATFMIVAATHVDNHDVVALLWILLIVSEWYAIIASGVTFSLDL